MAFEPITAILEIGGKIIDKIFPDKTEAEKAKLELFKLQQQGEFKELELRYSAIVEEAKSQDKWTSRARPSFLYVIYIYILAAIPMGFLYALKPDVVSVVIQGVQGWLHAIPDEMWWLFGAGYLGYGAYRTIDKRKNGGQ